MSTDLEERTTLSCAGVTADGVHRTVTVLGRLVPSTALSYSEATPERPGTYRLRDEQSRALALAIYGTPERVAEAAKRSIPSMPEAVHFNIPCENGWWIEVALYPEDDAIRFDVAGDPHTDADRSAAELLELLAEVGTRPRFQPTDLWEDPWCGIAPGAWFDRAFGTKKGSVCPYLTDDGFCLRHGDCTCPPSVDGEAKP